MSKGAVEVWDLYLVFSPSSSIFYIVRWMDEKFYKVMSSSQQACSLFFPREPSDFSHFWNQQRLTQPWWPTLGSTWEVGKWEHSPTCRVMLCKTIMLRRLCFLKVSEAKKGWTAQVLFGKELFHYLQNKKRTNKQNPQKQKPNQRKLFMFKTDYLVVSKM